MGKVENLLRDLYVTLCKQLEKAGYEEIEYQQSDEAIRETLIENQYEFLSNGKII